MLVRVSLALTTVLFVAGQVFGYDEEKLEGVGKHEGAGGGGSVDVQAHYVSDWKPVGDSGDTDVGGKFALTLKYGDRVEKINVSISPQDDWNQFTVVADVGGQKQKVGQGECYQSDHGAGNIYTLRYDGWNGLDVENPTMCDIKFKSEGTKVKLRKVYHGDSLLLIDGLIKDVGGEEGAFDFELLTDDGEQSLVHCGTDSGVYYCWGDT